MPGPDSGGAVRPDSGSSPILVRRGGGSRLAASAAKERLLCGRWAGEEDGLEKRAREKRREERKRENEKRGEVGRAKREEGKKRRREKEKGLHFYVIESNKFKLNSNFRKFKSKLNHKQ